MKLPVQVVFRDLVPLPSLEEDIRRRAAKLETFMSDLMSCHVAVSSSANQHQQGHLYSVRIDLRIKGGEIFVGEHGPHQQIEVAVREAFDALARRLEDHARRRRGQVKAHAERQAE